MLDGNVVVAHGFRGLLRCGKQAVHATRNIETVGIAPRTGHNGQLVDRRLRRSVKAFDRDVHFFQELRDQAVLLPQQRKQQMHLLKLLILMLCREALRVADSF